MNKSIIAFAVVTCLIAPTLMAQNFVTGSVVDAHGNPVAGYPVIVESDKTLTNGMSDIVGVTRADGNFQVMINEPGNYKVVLPTQPNEKLSFEVKKTPRAKGFLKLFSNSQTQIETEVGVIKLK